MQTSPFVFCVNSQTSKTKQTEFQFLLLFILEEAIVLLQKKIIKFRNGKYEQTILDTKLIRYGENNAQPIINKTPDSTNRS